MFSIITLCLIIAAQSTITDAPAVRDQTRIHQIQVLGTHNSYARPVDPRILDVIDPILGQLGSTFMDEMSPEQKARFEEEHPVRLPMKQALAYDHPSLQEQLDHGLRSLEIDVFHDPEGGRFLNPAAYTFLEAQGVTDLAPHDKTGLEAPGFKVLHVADIDVRSHCATLIACLGDLRDWSERTPDHEPVFVLLEIKTSAIPVLPGAAEVLPFDSAAFDALDKEIFETLGRDRLITPDDVRGTHETLETAVLAGAWPTLADARGKFVFLMLTAIEPEATAAYREERPNLEGRVAFVRSEPGHPYSAFILRDNALIRHDEIGDLVNSGYLVRTRSDINTYEARIDDYSRAEAAFSSGAQVISTDYFLAGPNVAGTDYRVTLPGGGAIRCNPVNAPETCRESGPE